ncbi:MAG: cytochrome C [Alphaproteobacteria bacterium]|nr:cytochrome C [Alphaproteobacteria bacterium]
MQNGNAEISKGLALVTNSKGNIQVPDVDYRKDWTMLGTYAVAADDGKEGSKGMHVVYTQPASVKAYRKTGKFPDGTVLLKELFSTTTASMTTGTVSRAKGTDGFFVMVKDSKNSYPDNKLWGDGWGWAFFKGGDRKNTTTKDYKAECLACHVPAKGNDWVYVEGYPVLRGK